ncbi:IMP-specific 5-nucleotidase [Fimicolochytrium jonesii]|uniref:IMP-specific 5-nucleotidase n=1 Tax=Fimicolochytrium jonesii TaxID=1396493 RepID=UPI0022FDF205|nr:IMP-specific 5-nucleotidase [Fimicolochytrium jonesii]KAI8826820.1 IMP-specific 5-nucleotidase [Fimicolochytrium jonesii]
MTSLYSINYHTRAHKRDAFIEFIKSLLLNPFVLHTRPSFLAADSEETPEWEKKFAPATRTQKNSHCGEGEETQDENVKRYCEVLQCVEELIYDHILHQRQNLIELSRLSALVPSIGRFFTPLPLRNSFIRQDAKRAIAARRSVPPSFNDIRAVLNDAQVTAISSTVKLMTFDGDMTLYADGANFPPTSSLVRLLITLLHHGLHIAVVTAAGYPNSPAKYETRLAGLLTGFRSSSLPAAALERFYVMGGECNYLFRYDAARGHLVGVAPEVYEPEAVRRWSTDEGLIAGVLDVAEGALRAGASEMKLEGKVDVLRKGRAVGVVPKDGVRLTRETLDEFALTAQRALTSHSLAQSRSPPATTTTTSTPPPTVPFCAFNGGSDVWVDIGNKLIGVQMLQAFLGTKGWETLHVGDQFLSTGNDISTRTACCTAWVTNPEETAEILTELCSLLGAGEGGK